MRLNQSFKVFAFLIVCITIGVLSIEENDDYAIQLLREFNIEDDTDIDRDVFHKFLFRLFSRDEPLDTTDKMLYNRLAQKIISNIKGPISVYHINDYVNENRVKRYLDQIVSDEFQIPLDQIEKMAEPIGEINNSMKEIDELFKQGEDLLKKNEELDEKIKLKREEMKERELNQSDSTKDEL